MFFRLNNIQFIMEKIEEIHIEHGIGDLEKLHGMFEAEVKRYVEIVIKEQFPGVTEFVGRYNPEQEETKDGEEIEEAKMTDLAGIDKEKLEKISNEFRVAFQDRINSSLKSIKDSS